MIYSNEYIVLLLHTAQEDEEEEEGEGANGDNDADIVGVYAERLSAVTHAFALCCQTVQKATGRCGVRQGKVLITVFPRIVCARSINFTVCVMHGIFEGAVYSRARSNSSRAVY